MPIQISGVQMGVITGGPSAIALADLSDVSIVSPLNGQYLRYNSGIAEWQNAYISDDVYDYLDGNLTSSNGVDLTFTPGPDTINIALSLTASGDASGSVTSGNLALTLATVNSNVGTFGSGTAIPVVTVNAKGLVTAVSTASFSGTAPLSTSLAGGAAGTVVYQSAAGTTAFLAAGTSSQVLIGGASAPSWSNTPTLTGTNFTGIPNGALTNSSLTLGSTSMSLGSTTTTVAGLTSVTSTTFVGALTGTATNATNTGITNDVATASAVYPTWVTANTGNLPQKVSSTKLSFVPSTGILTSTGFAGSGAGLTSIPNAALTNSSLTIGSTNIALGATSLTLAGLTSVAATTFSGALTGNATSATNIAAGTANQIPYQTGAAATSFYSAANYGVHIYGATGVPASVAGAAGVLQGSASAIPAFTTTPTLTGTNFTGIPNGALTNSSLTIGSTNIALGATSTTLAGLTSVTSTTFVGALTGNASTATSAAALTTSRSISATGDAAWTVNFDGSANVTAALTLATVNGSPQTDTFRKITVNGKGLVTATSAVASSDITTALGYTPVNKAGDTMTGALVLNADPTAALGAATKQYVDNVASGLSAHAACFTSTTATLAISSGGTVTYSNGASGVGATLTTTGSFATIGAASTTNGDRILVKNEAATANNGVYVRTSATVLTRATDFDDSPDGEVAAGDFVYIQNGTLGGTQWVVTTTGNIVIGTTGIVFSQLSGVGTITDGTGITVTGNSVALATGNTLSLFNLATNGLVARTAANTVTARNLAVSGTGLSVSNADGVSGNPTVTSNATNANTASTIVARDASGNFTAGTITAALTGNATSATNIAAGTANQRPYQTGAGATSFYSSANYGVTITGATGVPQTIAGAAGVLQGSASAIPAFTTTPTLTGTNFTGIPNAALTNNSLTIGSTNIALGATSLTLAGLTSVTATTFAGTLNGNITGGAAGTLVYQSAANTTAFLATVAAGSVLTSNGAAAPVWSTSPAMSSITVNSAANISQTTTAVTTNTATTIDSFAAATYRSAKYFVQVTDTTNSQYQLVEISVIHDGTTVFKTEYGQVATVAALGTFDASIATGTLSLQFTATVASTKSVKVYRTALTV